MMLSLDVSWRGAGKTIPVWLVGRTPPTLKDLEELGEVPEALLRRHPAEPISPACKFQLSSTGLLWYANSYTSIHGDESHGRLPDGIQPALRDRAKKGVPLVWGGVAFRPTGVVAFVHTSFHRAAASSILELHSGWTGTFGRGAQAVITNWTGNFGYGESFDYLGEDDG